MSAPCKCPKCGKRDNLERPGLINFRWVGGRWVPQRRTAEVCDTTVIVCRSCNVSFHDFNGELVEEMGR